MRFDLDQQLTNTYHQIATMIRIKKSELLAGRLNLAPAALSFAHAIAEECVPASLPDVAQAEEPCERGGA